MPEPLIETIDIICPPGKAFEYFSNFLNDSEWRSEVKDMRFLEDGGPCLGQRTVEDAAVFGARMATTTIISEWEPGRRVKAITQAGPAPVIIERICTPIPGGTRLTYQLKVDVSKMILFRIFRPIVSRYFHNKVRDNLLKLKAILEKP